MVAAAHFPAGRLRSAPGLMLTKLRIRNFKRLDDVDIDLAGNVVFIGPNNSGKTSALQALALWSLAVQRWAEKNKDLAASASKRPGVTINRKDVLAVPVPHANLLWRNLHTRAGKPGSSKPQTQNVRIDVEVVGTHGGDHWHCGMEFDYSSEEALICRPKRKRGFESASVRESEFESVPKPATLMRVAYLPPMSGLAATEPKWEPGRINVLLGEGQTAQVLRNLCHVLASSDEPRWRRVCDHMNRMFGVELLPPEHISARGEISMAYRSGGIELDLSSAGRGLQQALLILAYLYTNPGAVILMDEPDAHLEILRQREMYTLISDVAREVNSQVVAASHSEVVLNEAAARDTVVAFIGKPHVLSRNPSQLKKALTTIGWEDYALAEQTGWVLYLESASDRAILMAFARRLRHPAASLLERCFVQYVSNNLPQLARDHFFGLREAKDDLLGLALFDRLDKQLRSTDQLLEFMWRRREIENYLCTEQTLLRYAAGSDVEDLIGFADAELRTEAMRGAIREIGGALMTLRGSDLWSPDLKASEEVLDPIFRKCAESLGQGLALRTKQDYAELVQYVPDDEIDPEIAEKLDAIVELARRAEPTRND